jgi:hypothetical protein
MKRRAGGGHPARFGRDIIGLRSRARQAKSCQSFAASQLPVLAAGAFVEPPQNSAAKSTASGLRPFASRAIGLCFLFAYA